MNGWCTPENDQDVLLVLHASLVDTLSAFLKPYLLFSRNTSLTDLRADLVLLTSLDIPEDMPEDVPADAPEDLPAIETGLVLDARRRLFPVSALADAQRLWERHSHVSAEAWWAALTADGIPLVSAPVSETFLPQMLNLETLGAIDFEKGCYLGQEVVARAQHRGEVKRRLTPLTWRGPTPPDPGRDVTDLDGKVHGMVLQSAADGADSGPLLAVLHQGAPEALWQGDTHLRRVR
jgi:folate-binding protein YgfZ